MKICICSTLGQASSGRVVTTCHLNRLQGPSLSIDLGMCVCLMALKRCWIIFSCFIQTQFWTNLFNSQMTMPPRKQQQQQQRNQRRTKVSGKYWLTSFLYTKVYSQFVLDRGQVNIICDSSQPVSVPRRTFTVCYNFGHPSVTCVYNPGQSGHTGFVWNRVQCCIIFNLV